MNGEKDIKLDNKKEKKEKLNVNDVEPSTSSELVFKNGVSNAIKQDQTNLKINFKDSTPVWDPEYEGDWNLEKPDINCIKRIKKDLISIFEDPIPGIFVLPNNDEITKLDALIIGPSDTPYEGGFFHFLVRFPPTYPFNPPRVKLMTTSDNKIRFNPNLYKNGKVCLSILGTWNGPTWLASQTLSSLLMSIQSLLNSKPYHNEPGFEKEKIADGVKNYNKLILHETLRVAVCENLENENFKPEPLQKIMKDLFLEYYDHYEDVCNSNLKLDGSKIIDSLYKESYGEFRFNEILNRLQSLKSKLSK